MYIRYIASILLIWSLSSTLSKAQDTSQIFISAYYQQGFMLNHSSVITHLIKGPPRSIDLQAGKQTSGHKYWHSSYRYPDVGAGLRFFDSGNPDTLGYAGVGYVFIRTPFLRRPRLNAFYSLSAGMAAFTRWYHQETNSRNLALGSSLNAFLDISLSVSYHISPNITLFAGYGISHYSNGRTLTPNMGLNPIVWNTGIRYLPALYRVQKSIEPPRLTKNAWHIMLGAGIKEPHVLRHSTRYPAGSVELSYHRYYSKKHSIGIGADLFWDATWQANDFTEVAIHKEQVYSAIHLAHEVHWGNTFFSMQYGIFLHNKQITDEPWYMRYGLYYIIGSHWVTGASLKVTPWAIADFAELSLGYRLSY